MPGFIEGHGHFEGLGQSKMMLDLRGAEVWDDIVRQVERAAADAEPGQWIIGRGWHQAKWKRPPQRASGRLSQARGAFSAACRPTSGAADARDRPHVPGQREGHGAGRRQLETRQPNGGEILRDEAGEPIGVFRERLQGSSAGHDKANKSHCRGDGRGVYEAVDWRPRVPLEGRDQFCDAGASRSPRSTVSETLPNVAG